MFRLVPPFEVSVVSSQQRELGFAHFGQVRRPKLPDILRFSPKLAFGW